MTHIPAPPADQGLCPCGAAIPLDLRLPHGRPVTCAACGKESRVWQAAARANRHAPRIGAGEDRTMTDQSGGAEGTRGSPLSSSPRHRPTQIGRITSVQARMARAAIDRNQTQVARATGCAIGTVHLFERTADEVSKKNAGVIRRHYEEMGVQFWADAYFHIVAVPK